MKYLWCVALLALCGCASLDWAFGVDPITGEDKPGESPIETGGGLVGMWIPWATAAATGLKAIYDNFRKRQYLKGLTAVVGGVEDAMKHIDENGDGKISKDELVAMLQRKQNQVGVQPLIAKIMGLVK